MKKHLSHRSAARIGTAVMAAILIGMVALFAGTMYWSQRAIADVESSIRVSDAYNQTALNAALVSVHFNAFRTSGDPEELSKVQSAFEEVFQDEALVKEIGTDEDRAFLAEMDSRYAPDIAQAAQAIQAAATGDITQGTDAGTETLQQITQALSDRAESKRESALQDLASYESTVRNISAGGIAALLLAMPLVMGAYVMTRGYERKEIVREVELERLKQAALTDGLTGLANHRAFQEDLKREVARAARYERPITIAMMDVDDFKEVNDSQGHARGDVVLAELAGLMSYVRSHDRAYRVGGDEFALIMPETGPEEAEVALERLRTTIESSMPGTSISIGFSSTLDTFSPETLRDHADLALYDAKRRGKNQVATFRPSLTQGGEVTTAKTQAIRRVLDSGRVEMWYQPIYHYESKDLLAFEALLRLPWEPEVDGPQEAFQIATGLGKARDLDLLCVAQALATADSLPSDVKLFINLDPATLTNSRFSVQDLAEIVAASRFDPSQIVFEVTEQTVVPVTLLQHQIEAIRALGFGVALDDVGTGNAGLELMRMIKFDYVKIDRSVIVDASIGGQGRAVILAIVAFARETGSFMIAEGIEDASLLKGIHLDEPGLRDFWVRGVQGFLLGEPRSSMSSYLPVSDTAKFRPRSLIYPPVAAITRQA